MRYYPDKTVDEEFQTLGTEGYSGALNDRIKARLEDSGYTGSIDDTLKTFRDGLTIDGTGINWLGDSVASQSFDSATQVGSIGLAAGTVRQAGGLFGVVSNFSAGGTTSADLAAQATSAIAGAYDVSIIHTGSNDASVAVTRATYLTNVKAACTDLKSNDHIVILCVPTQREDAAWTGTMQTQLEEYWEDLIAEPVGPYWDYIVRTDQVSEWSSDGVTVNTDMKLGPASEAGVHPPAEGSYYLTKKIKTALTNKITKPTYTSLVAETLTGTTGSINGGYSGDLATGFIGEGSVLGTTSVVLSKPTDSEQALAFSGTAGTNTLGVVYGTFNAVAAAKVVRMKLKVKADASITGVASFSVGISDHLGTVKAVGNFVVTNLYDLGAPWANLGADVEGGYVTYWSPPYTVPGGGENLGLYVDFYLQNSTATGGTITITEPELVELT